MRAITLAHLTLIMTGAMVLNAQAATRVDPLPISMIYTLTEAIADLPLQPILFKSGSYEVVADDQQVLQALGKTIGDLPIYVLVEAFTDAKGTPEANLVLSQKRAQAVAAAIMANGVLESNQVVTIGHGSRFALDKSGDARGDRSVRITLLRSKNRTESAQYILAKLAERGIEFRDVAARSVPQEEKSEDITPKPKLDIGLSLLASASAPFSVVRGLDLTSPMSLGLKLSIPQLFSTFNGYIGISQQSYQITGEFRRDQYETFSANFAIGGDLIAEKFFRIHWETGIFVGQGELRINPAIAAIGSARPAPLSAVYGGGIVLLGGALRLPKTKIYPTIAAYVKAAEFGFEPGLQFGLSHWF